MAEVVRFSALPNRWPTDRPGLRKRGAPWRAIDLKGQPPAGHRSPSYGPKQKTLIATEQVWVEVHTQRLFVVTELTKVRETFYPHDVIFVPYKQHKPPRRLAETTFRSTMEIWDVFDAKRHASVAKVRDLAEKDSGSPWRGQADAGVCAINFFGLDREGYRID